MKSFISIALLVCASFLNQAQAGRESGGGDEFTVDFVRVSTQVIYPWLVTNGSKLTPPVDSAKFILAVDPTKLVSVDHVYESCDGTTHGREVEACYSGSTGLTYLSRTRYPLQNDSTAKLGFIAHEIFRKMGIEGDNYEISRQMNILNDDGCGPSIASLKSIFGSICSSIPGSQLYDDCGNSFHELIAEWQEGIGKQCRNQAATNACMEGCSPRLGEHCLEFCGSILN